MGFFRTVMDIPLQELNALVLSTLATKYATVASATFLVWDMLLTVEDEISFVWNKRKTAGSFIFFLNRYIPPFVFIFDLYVQLVYSPSAKFCQNYQISSTLLDILSIAVIECVLVLRTHAMYQNKYLLVALCCLSIMSIGVMLGLFMVLFRHETFFPASIIGLSGCLSNCVDRICTPVFLAIFWIPFVIFESVVLVLTTWKSYKSASTTHSRNSQKLLGVLIRDGALYYSVIMSISIANFFIWTFNPFAPYLAIGVLKALQATICSRLLLNIRQVANETLYTQPVVVSRTATVQGSLLNYTDSL